MLVWFLPMPYVALLKETGLYLDAGHDAISKVTDALLCMSRSNRSAFQRHLAPGWQGGLFVSVAQEPTGRQKYDDIDSA